MGTGIKGGGGHGSLFYLLFFPLSIHTHEHHVGKDRQNQNIFPSDSANSGLILTKPDLVAARRKDHNGSEFYFVSVKFESSLFYDESTRPLSLLLFGKREKLDFRRRVVDFFCLVRRIVGRTLPFLTFYEFILFVVRLIKVGN